MVSVVNMVFNVIGAAAGIAIVFTFVCLVRQLKLNKKTLEAQVKAIDVQAKAISAQLYTSMNIEFLNIISNFKENINQPNSHESDFEEEEKRALDRYFYLANMEYILYKLKVIDEEMANQWLRGIESSAKKTPFVERWKSTASKFALDKEFQDFFERAMEKNQ